MAKLYGRDVFNLEELLQVYSATGSGDRYS